MRSPIEKDGMVITNVSRGVWVFVDAVVAVERVIGEHHAAVQEVLYEVDRQHCLQRPVQQRENAAL